MAQVNTMLPNGRNSGNQTVPEVQTAKALAATLDEKIVNMAKKAIDAIYDGYQEVSDLMSKANRKAESLSGIMRNLAVEAVKLAGNSLPLARNYFAAICEVAEIHLQDQHKTPNGTLVPMGELLPLWTQTKSVILAGFKENVNPAQVKTVSGVREAVRSIREARNAPQGVQDRGAQGPMVTTAGDHLRAGWSTKLASAFNVLMLECKNLDERGQDKAAAILGAAIREIHSLRAAHDVDLKKRTGEVVNLRQELAQEDVSEEEIMEDTSDAETAELLADEIEETDDTDTDDETVAEFEELADEAGIEDNTQTA